MPTLKRPAADNWNLSSVLCISMDMTYVKTLMIHSGYITRNTDLSS